MTRGSRQVPRRLLVLGVTFVPIAVLAAVIHAWTIAVMLDPVAFASPMVRDIGLSAQESWALYECAARLPWKQDAQRALAASVESVASGLGEFVYVGRALWMADDLMFDVMNESSSVLVVESRVGWPFRSSVQYEVYWGPNTIALGKQSVLAVCGADALESATRRSGYHFFVPDVVRSLGECRDRVHCVDVGDIGCCTCTASPGCLEDGLAPVCTLPI